MDRIITAAASGLGDGIGFLASSGLLFVVFAVIWGAFGVGLVASQGSVDAAWDLVNGLPLVLRALVWLLFLPVMGGLWIWETTWPLAVRLLLLIGIAGWNLLIFLPRAVTVAR
jgi:hypothetical protein